MTHYVNKRTLTNPDAYPAAVDAYTQELYSWYEHHRRVKAGETGYQAHPPPRAHPDLQASVRLEEHDDGSVTLTPDYQLIEGTYVPPGNKALFDTRKQELFHQISQMELEAIHKILPAGKWRLIGYKFQLAVEAVNAAQRAGQPAPYEHKSTIDEHNQRLTRHRDVQLHFAQLQSDVEDLTFETINNWQPKPFG